MSSWFSDAAEVDARPGGDGTLSWNGRGVNRPVTVALRVERVEPPRLFSFRWDHPAGSEPREGNSMLVEFTLTAEGT